MTAQQCASMILKTAKVIFIPWLYFSQNTTRPGQVDSASIPPPPVLIICTCYALSLSRSDILSRLKVMKLVVLILAKSLRRWANIKTTLGQRDMFLRCL